MKKRSLLFFAVSTYSLLAMLSPRAQAATASTWKSSSASWTSTAAWSAGATPTSTTTAVINNNGTATLGPGESGTAAILITGSSTKGNLLIDGGSLVTGTAVLGYGSASASGSAAVTSGTWASASIILGGTGSGTLTMSGSADVTVGGGTGTLMLGLGTKGVGVLNYNGGTLNAALVDIGKGTGTINITTGSFAPSIIASGTGAMNVNYLGTGTFSLSGSQSFNGVTAVDNGTLAMSGATVNQAGKISVLRIADQAGISGTTNFTGGTVASFSTVFVGMTGTGTVNLSDATVNSTSSSIAHFAGSSGTFSMSSGTWNNTDEDGEATLDLGEGGSGVMTITGGVMNVDVMRLATSQDSAGELNISSGTLGITDSLTIGNSGTGTVNMTGGMVSVENNVYLGGVVTATGFGTLNISSGTFCASDAALSVGNMGTGTANLTGGLLSTSGVYIGGGDSTSGTGTVNVSGGTWDFNWFFDIGYSDVGTLNVSGGEIDDTGGLGIDLAFMAGSTGTINFSGGTMNVATITGGPGDATVNFTTTGSATFTPDMTGTMNVNQTGPGTTVLTGNSDFTGITTISAGKLTVNGSITADSVVNGGMLNGSGTTGNVTVNNGGTLGGSLRSGVVTVNAGGTVSPGNSPGANSATSLTLNAGAIFKADIAAPLSGSWAGAHPVAGIDYDQMTLTGSSDGVAETVLTLNSTAGTGSILRLNITGALPASGLADPATPYDPNGPNISLDNYFVLNLSDSADTINGRFARVTLDGINFVDIDYSATNLFDGLNGIGTFTLDGYTWAISYHGDSATNSTIGGNDVVITAMIPEPATCALLGIGLLTLAAWNRRKRPLAKS